jgi:hypothetical protein
MANMKSRLQERAEELTAQLPIMVGKDKGDLDNLIGTHITINNVDRLTTQELDKKTKTLVSSTFAVFTIQEDDTHFFFGGLVLTEHLFKLVEDGFLEDIQAEGLPTLLTKKKAKSGQIYTNVEFYPEIEQVQAVEAPSKTKAKNK